MSRTIALEPKAIKVRKKKSELDLSLEEVKEGKIVTVGSVDNLMKYLHS